MQDFIGILGAVGIGSILAAIVAGVFSKRKLGAEATEIITRAAAGVVEDLRDELARARQERVDAESRHQDEWDEVRRVLQLHAAWDAIAADRAREKGIELPPPPPMLPPRLGHGLHH